MAFLCPSRLGRSKQKRGYYSMMRKLTKDRGFDSITLEDLVKLSWTTQDSRRIILQNFTSCEPQEITVKQGQKVNYIYREGDWAYVVTDDKKEGFVPFTFLAKIGVPSTSVPTVDTGTYTKKKSDVNPRNFSVESEETDHSGSDLVDDSFSSPTWSSDSGSVVTIQDQPSVKYLQAETHDRSPMLYEVFLDERTNILHKSPLPLATFDDRETQDHTEDISQPVYSVLCKAMYNFAGKDAYDVPVKAGETVYLLDDSDPGWFWVRKPDGSEGYVPSNYIIEITEPTIEYLDNNLEEGIGNTRGHLEKISTHKQHTEDINSNKIGLPINWKVTNELKGKIPATAAMDSDNVGTKKQRPKKPPRKKHASLDSLSPRLDESLDSIDTYITDSTVDCIDYQTKSSCDEFSPRSNDVSDCSVFDSSFNGVYNGRHGVNKISDTELSPRSVDTELQFDDTTILIVEPKGTKSKDDSDFLDERSTYRSDNVTGFTKSHKHQHEEKPHDITDSQKHHVKSKHGNKNNSVSHSTNYRERPVSCETSDSFESRSSHGQRHKRPVSMPAFKSYQEYKKDYFDEYFYDDNDTKFASRSKQDVVNVAEILKMRKTNENQIHRHPNEKYRTHVKHTSDKNSSRRAEQNKEHTNNKQKVSQPKENRDTHNKPKLKQFLLNLQSTKIENQPINMEHQSTRRHHSKINDDGITGETIAQYARKRYSSTSDMNKNLTDSHRDYVFKKETIKHNKHDKNNTHKIHGDTKIMKHNARQYNSSNDLRQIETKHSLVKEQGKDMNLSENQNKIKSQKKTHIRPYNSSTDLREIGGKPDWSFGYPRRTRQSIGRKDNEMDFNKHQNDNTCISYRNSKPHCETEEKSQHVDKFDSRQNTRINENQDISCKTTRRASSNGTGEEQKNEISFDDSAMAALLSETDNLLHKTDELLHIKDRKQRMSEQLKHEINQNVKVVNICDRKDTETPPFVSQKQFAETNAAEKCNQFLNNSTIGIHGMTYFVTEENRLNSDNPSETTLRELAKDSGGVSSSRRVEVEGTDLRKEKSNVMKDNSSKSVSEGLKSLDLKDVRGITEFVSQCNCDIESDDMLSIKHGEILHICLDGQDNAACYWAFSPRLRKYGFVPKQYVKIPLVTII